MTEKVIARFFIVAVLLVSAVFGVRWWRNRNSMPTSTIQVTNPSGQPVSIEVKALTPTGAMAADSLRNKVNEINAGYLALQDQERKTQNVGSDWVLDLPGNRLVHQPATQSSAPAPAPAKK